MLIAFILVTLVESLTITFLSPAALLSGHLIKLGLVMLQNDTVCLNTTAIKNQNFSTGDPMLIIPSRTTLSVDSVKLFSFLLKTVELTLFHAPSDYEARKCVGHKYKLYMHLIYRSKGAQR